MAEIFDVKQYIDNMPFIRRARVAEDRANADYLIRGIQLLIDAYPEDNIELPMDFETFIVNNSSLHERSPSVQMDKYVEYVWHELYRWDKPTEEEPLTEAEILHNASVREMVIKFNEQLAIQRKQLAIQSEQLAMQRKLDGDDYSLHTSQDDMKKRKQLQQYLLGEARSIRDE